jgi:hypothetical protein
MLMYFYSIVRITKVSIDLGYLTTDTIENITF